MGTFIEKMMLLQNPQIVADFQKMCGIEILSKTKTSENGVCSNMNGVAEGELHKRVGHKNGIVQNSTNCFIPGKEVYQNGTVHQNGVCHAKKSNDIVEEHSDSSKKVEYTVHNKFLYWIFRCGAELGNEFFYLTFFTFCVWNLDSIVTRQMAIIWHAGMYIGQAIKDIVCWHRPASPPCARLEQRYAVEYGMPSTHATVGVIIPFGLLLIAHRHYEFDMAYPLMFTTFWTLVCGLSRIYLGMHTVLVLAFRQSLLNINRVECWVDVRHIEPMRKYTSEKKAEPDVIMGAALGIVMIPIFLPYVEDLDKLQVSSPYGALYIVGGSIFLLYIYPNPPIWNTAKGDTAIVEGVGGGISVGFWINCQLGLGIASESAPFEIPSLTISWLCLAILRSVIGVSILVITRAIAKPMSIALCCKYYNVDKKDEKTQRELCMEKPQKYIAYFSVSVCAIVLVPYILGIFGIMRMSFYSEMYM